MIEQRPTTQSVNVDDEPIIDVKAAGYFLGYLMRSIRRRKSTVMMTFMITAVLVGGLCVVLPRVYKISTRILTHRSLMMMNIVNPERTIPKEVDNPTAGAKELIKSRENLENLMNDIKLEEVWEAKRPMLWRWKDKAFGAVFGTPTEQDKHEAFLKLLDDKITAEVVDGELVTMDVEWPDPDIAMSLAEGAVARFRKMRHDMELSELLETVNILERNVESSRQGIEEAVTRMQKTFNAKERDLQARGVSKGVSKSQKHKVIAIRRPQGADVIDPAADELKKNLQEKQAQLGSVKRAYESKLKEAQQHLSELRSTLGPEHPDVQDAKRELDKLAQMPPELQALSTEEATLSTKVGALPAGPSREEPKVKVESRDQADDGEMVRVAVSDELYQELESDPEIASIMDDLKKREDTHDNLLRRLAGARIESETADVAFEYRYIMTAPPVYPKRPVKPNIPLMAVGGLVVGLLLGVAFAVAADVFSKRVLEAWQLQRFLNLKVLGEIKEQ